MNTLLFFIDLCGMLALYRNMSSHSNLPKNTKIGYFISFISFLLAALFFYIAEII